MYEFDSVSVSAFEAAELAATLTAKSAEGWDVAGIVTAGSDVVAYLRRETGSESAKQDAPTAVESTPGSESPQSQPVSTLSSESASPRAEPAAETSSPSDLLAGGSSSTPSAETGNTGWGSSTDSSSSTAGWGTSSSDGSWGGSSQQSTAPASVPTTPSVPAGWYADPAGRYELRYWDGGAWTEHVSRAGQQYTDPPVA